MAKKKSKSWFAKQLKALQKQLDLIEEQETQEQDASIGDAIPKSETVGTNRYTDVYEDIQPNEFSHFHQEDSAITLYSKNKEGVRILFLKNSILRISYSKNEQFKNSPSFAIQNDLSFNAIPYICEEKKYKIRLQTQKLICDISKKDLTISIKDLKGNIVCEDYRGYLHRQTLLRGTTKVSLSKKTDGQECFYGLGDKSCSLNLKGHQLRNYNEDAFGYGVETDPLYRTVPFYFGLRDKKGYGIFFDNTYQTHFDFDSEGKGEVQFWADGGVIDYYFIYGPELLKVAEQYALLTGLPELPPMWALGFHQCRWSYFPDKRVKEVAKEFRDRSIPCDAIYLDIDYMDGYRCFTWNKEYFPDPKGVIKDLAKKGFQTVVMIDPGIRVDEEYHVYQQGIKNDYFCKRTNGDLMQGPVWPSNCVWPDFTHPEVRKWWGKLYKELYLEIGVSGFWNDMNEPAVFQVHHKTFPDEVLHYNEGHPTNHAQIHNVYGLQMSKATLQGLKKLNPNKRPFLLTRATYAGGQKYAAIWTGDNIASWEHLHLASTQCQRLSASGFSFVGSDIGGFFKYPDGEMMVRWLQLGIFHPFYRVHSMGNNDDGSAEADTEKIKKRDSLNRLDQEPWAFGKAFTPAARQAIELRYQLLPYIYTTFWQHTQQGTPMIRQLAFYDQTDKNTYNREKEFLFGDGILVHPVTESGVKKSSIYLPKGKWFDYWTGESYKGKQTVKIATQIDRIPIFIKAGSIIPLYPVMQYTNEKPIEELTLKVYYHNESSVQYLYEDAGEGYQYQQQEYCLRTYTTNSKKNNFQLEQDQKGKYKAEYKQILLAYYGLPFKVKKCVVDGIEIPFNKVGSIIQVEVPSDFKIVRLEWK